MNRECGDDMNSIRKDVKCIRIVDGYDNPIPNDNIDVFRFEDDYIGIRILNYHSGLSQSELFTLMNLINDKIKYGVHVEDARKYLELLDRLEKIVERKVCK